MASSFATGSSKSMSESRTEALQALIDSLKPGAGDNGVANLSSHVEKLSDKLGGLLGEDAMLEMPQRNEKGELVNEEGLPIIDIVEPIPASVNPSSTTGAIPAIHDPDLIPLWALSPAERARVRAERDRMFDMLEAEEQMQQEKEEAEERERFKAELDKRKQAAEADMDALKKAREMQKKMGKALLRNLAEARDREEQEKRTIEEADRQAREERKKLKPKKSVTFADLPPDHEHQPANSVPMPPPFDWGDVSPAKLQPGGKSTLLTKVQMEKGPMRMNVVERVPGISKGPKSPPPPQKDSDDESDSESGSLSESAEGDVVHASYSDEDHPPSSHEGSESDYGALEDSEPIEWDDESYDFARHQREVALEYYEKRTTVGAQAFAAMRNHEHADEEHEWDKAVVPLEATLASSPPKPNVSRFRAERSSSSLPSQSLGASLLPASQSSSLKAAVRVGKLENGNLVGGEEGESDDEVDSVTKEMLEMLKKGEVVNVGPTLPSSNAAAVDSGLSATSTPTMSTLASPESQSVVQKPQASRVSKFKVSLLDSSPASSPASPGSSLSTPINVAERSSPKLPSLAGTPVPIPSKLSHAHRQSQTTSGKRPAQMPGVIVDSPSFPAPGIVSSASFTGSSGEMTSPTPHSMVIESPSFQSPGSTVVGTPRQSSHPSPVLPSPATPTVSTPVNASVVERRPAVLGEVRETGGEGSRAAESTHVAEKKRVSRFLAQRT